MRKQVLTVALAHFAIYSLPRFGHIELVYNSEDEIPEQHKDLYTEQNGSWILTGVKGGGKENIDRLQNALNKERNDHKSSREKYAKLNGRDIDELLQRDSEYDELKLRAEKIDDNKIEDIVNVRIKNKLAPLERERDELKNKLGVYETEVTELKTKEVRRVVGSALRKAARSSKAVDSAIDDIEELGSRLFELDENGKVVAKDNVGITPGIDPAMWLNDIRDKKPHWFPGNVGGGAGGNRGGYQGANPFSADGWNLTGQAKLMRENPDKAKQLASMAGVDLANPKRPAKK